MKTVLMSWIIHPSDKMDKKIMSIIVVVIIVIAAIGAYAIISLNSKESSETVMGDAKVYGNANGDCYIDDADIDIIKDIMDGKKNFEDYPLAETVLINSLSPPNAC
jgi:hypothetical protein